MAQELITRTKTVTHCVRAVAQKTRARFVGVISPMRKSQLVQILLLTFGILIGVLVTSVYYELEGIEKNMKSANGDIGTLEYYAKNGIGNEFCFEAYLSMAGLHEIDAIINAKPILDWFRPNLRSEAKQAKMRMQETLSQFPKKFECEESFFIDASLRELGYDL